jgi:uncharacterized protein (TIGR00251 family)
MTDWHRWDGTDLLLEVRVQPRASRDAFVLEDGRLRVRTTAPPVEGAANEHLCRWLAREFGVAPSRVHLVRGAASREKSFRITAPVRVPAPLASALALPADTGTIDVRSRSR